MKQIVLIAHNLRSTHNVGSLLRTADGLGIQMVYLTGYTPFPALPDDPRLPHIAQRVSKQIHKTALGAEFSTPWKRRTMLEDVFATLHEDNYVIYALEQAETARKITELTKLPEKLALLVGREVEGVEPDVLRWCDGIIEIPMLGHKESFNVVQAAAIALYHCRFMAKA